MHITAAVVKAAGQPFTIESVELEEPRAHEVLVRVVATGLCHTDLATRAGVALFPFPAVLGHEGAGVIERVGPAVTRLRPGDHVVLSFYACGECATCSEGREAYCPQGFLPNYSGARADGSRPISQDGQALSSNFFSQSSFATYALAHENNAVKVEQDLPLELLGPLGCGLQTGAGAVMNALRVKAGSSIVIFGTGAVGMAAIMAARVVGATTIIGVDLNNDRLRLASELGATHTLNPGEVDVLEQVRQLTNGGADYSLEAVGSPKVLRQAFDALSRTGVCGLLGMPPFGTEVTLNMTGLLSGRTIRGIIEGDSSPQTFIPQLIALYREGRFPFDRLVRFYRLDQINEAAHNAEHGAVIKPILRMAEQA